MSNYAMKMVIQLTLSIILTAASNDRLFAQSPPFTSGCPSKDANKLNLFISFERSGEGAPHSKGESRQRVWLRLHNNTSCTILIPTASAKLSRLPNGQPTFLLQDSVEMIVDFDIEDTERGKAPVPAYRRGDSGGVLSHLPAGISIVFSVPITVFKKQLKVSVPFRYEWEGAGTPGQGLVVHRVHFDSGSLPEGVIRQAKLFR